MDLSLINTSWGIYIQFEKNQNTAVFVSINNETQSVPLLCSLWRFDIHAILYSR